MGRSSTVSNSVFAILRVTREDDFSFLPSVPHLRTLGGSPDHATAYGASRKTPHPKCSCLPIHPGAPSRDGAEGLSSAVARTEEPPQAEPASAKSVGRTWWKPSSVPRSLGREKNSPLPMTVIHQFDGVTAGRAVPDAARDIGLNHSNFLPWTDSHEEISCSAVEMSNHGIRFEAAATNHVNLELTATTIWQVDHRYEHDSHYMSIFVQHIPHTSSRPAICTGGRIVLSTSSNIPPFEPSRPEAYGSGTSPAKAVPTDSQRRRGAEQ